MFDLMFDLTLVKCINFLNEVLVCVYSKYLRFFVFFDCESCHLTQVGEEVDEFLVVLCVSDKNSPIFKRKFHNLALQDLVKILIFNP